MANKSYNPLLKLPLSTPVPEIADPVVDSVEHEMAIDREKGKSDISVYPWLPQAADSWMDDLYFRMEEAERQYVAPNLESGDYTIGTAVQNDDIAVVEGSGNFLFTAPHATRTVRRATGKLGFADTGTAGLTAVLAEEYGNGLIMRGRQTSNAATDPNHPLKAAVNGFIPEASGFIDVHGSASHLFVHPLDRYNVHASIGLGEDPSDTLHDFGVKVMRFGRELGLNVIIGNDQKYYSQKSPEHFRRNDDGTVFTNRLAGAKPDMMNNYVRRAAAEAGRDLLSLQMEMSGFCRISPQDSNKSDKKTKIIGVALGYVLLEYIVEQANSYNSDNV